MGLNNAFTTLGETLQENFSRVARWSDVIDRKLRTVGISRPFRHALYGCTALAGATFTVASPIQALGLAGFAMAQMTPFLLDNSLKRANAVMACAILAPQLYLLGAPVGALQVGFAGTRAFMMNVIDDDSYKTRVGLGTAFWAGAIGISVQNGLINSVVDILPLAAMTCGTIADTCTDKMTHIARVFRIAGAGFLLPYHAGVSKSLGGFANEAIGAVNLFRTAVQNDIPVKDEKGEPIKSLRGQLAGWWRSVRSLERIPSEQAGRRDPFMQAIDIVRRKNVGLAP
jgi:hypothetical protein